MSLQSERLLGHMQRLRLSHLPACYESLAETAATKNLPYLDFLEQLLEAESSAKHARNVRLKTQWAHFPYNKGLEQFDFSFQPSIEQRKLREAGGAGISGAQGEHPATGSARSCDILLHLTNSLKLGAVARNRFEFVEHSSGS